MLRCRVLPTSLRGTASGWMRWDGVGRRRGSARCPPANQLGGSRVGSCRIRLRGPDVLPAVEFASGHRPRRWLVTGGREPLEESRIGPFASGAGEDSDGECGQSTSEEGDGPNPSAVPFPAKPGTPHPHRAGHKGTDGGKDGDPIGGPPRQDTTGDEAQDGTANRHKQKFHVRPRSPHDGTLRTRSRHTPTTQWGSRKLCPFHR